MAISVSDLVEANPKSLPHAFGTASYKQVSLSLHVFTCRAVSILALVFFKGKRNDIFTDTSIPN